MNTIVPSARNDELSQSAADPALWPLDRSIQFLNHGSFGSCPRRVLNTQQHWRELLEREPVQFLGRELETLLDRARAALADFVGAPLPDIVFIPNATAGVNTVLRSLSWNPGDELLVTNHAYNACRNALNYAAERAGATVVVAEIPFPLRRAEQVVEAVLEKTGPRTKLALLDHVTSPTALVLPIAVLVEQLKARGVDTLIDGAHAPGMVPVNLAALGAAYYTGNCHKWLCSPKGAGFLYVRPDRQERIRPLTISHGANSPRTDRSRFLIEFAWTGTHDPSAYLTVPEAIRCIGGLLPKGWPGVMEANRELAVNARKLLCRKLYIPPPCPDSMIGSIASLPLPTDPGLYEPGSAGRDPLQEWLFKQHRIEVPLIRWPAPPHRVLRISAQLYNRLEQYQALAEALAEHFGRE